MARDRQAADRRLDRSIGVGRVLFQSIAAMGPGASIVFGLGLIILYSGEAAPFSMLVGVIAALFIALAIGQLAQHVPSAGGFYSYTNTALGNSVGFLVGWVYSVLYVLLVCLSSLNFSLVGKDFCNTYLNFDPPYWPLVLLVVGFTFATTYFGIKPSTGVTAVLGIIEVVILLVVSVLLIIHAGDANTLTVFNPSNAHGVEPSTFRAIFLGVVFAFAALTGFEAAVPLAEEAREPRRTIPRAVFGSALLVGLFYVLAIYTAVVAWGPNKLSGYVNSPDPWRVMAHELGGFFALLVVLAILNSVIAGTQAGFNATSRLLYAMGRAGAIPRPLGAVHPVHRTPHVAATASAVMSLAFIFVAAGLFHGAFPGFVFFLTVASIVFISLYMVVSIDAAVFFLTKRRDEFNFVKHIVVPLVGLSILLPTMYYSLRGLTYPANRAVPVLAVWLVLGIIALVVIRIRGVDISADKQRWLTEDSVGGELSDTAPTHD